MYIFRVCDPLTKNVSRGIMAKKSLKFLGIPFKTVHWKLSSPFKRNNSKFFSGNSKRNIYYHFDAVFLTSSSEFAIHWLQFLDLVAGEHHKSRLVSYSQHFFRRSTKIQKVFHIVQLLLVLSDQAYVSAELLFVQDLSSHGCS